jgi:hypothetical protein
VELSSHDEDGTCFGKILRVYRLHDAGLALLERVIAAGVDHALQHQPDAELAPDLQALGVGLDLLGIGFGISADDPEHLAQAIPVYDALLCLCRARTLPDDLQKRVPPLPGPRTEFLRAALADR